MDTFIINNVSWIVKYVPPTDSSLWRAITGKYVLGCCDNVNKAIYINNSLDKTLSKKVLGHEITHAAMFSYNVNLTIEQEELVADLIATYGDEIIYITNKIFNKLREGY